MLVEQDGLAVKAEALLAKPVARTRAAALPIVLACGDVLVLLSSYVVTVVKSEAYTFDLNPDLPRWLIWCVVLAGIWVPIAVNHGAYDRTVMRAPFRGAYVVAKSTIIAGALFHIVPLIGGPVYSRFASMTVVLTFVTVMVGWRLLVARILPRQAPRDLVVLGAGWAGQTLADAISKHPMSDTRIVAFVDNDPDRVGGRERGIPVYPLSELGGLVRQATGPARVVVAMPDEAQAIFYEELSAVAHAGIEILSMAKVYESITGRVPVHHLGSFWWARLPMPSEDIVYRGAKRFTDVALGLAGLVVLAILLPIVAPLLLLESGRPLFFRQQRVGGHDRSLTVVKLRTLPRQGTAHSDYWERKRANKPTRLGALLRATGIDELPQCWNVLKGEMSIVGPRPYVPDEVADFQRQIPFFRCRALVKPGLTGWAQVNWGYGLSLEDEIVKLQYDLYYVGNQSFYLDVLIVLLTVRLALRRARPRPPQDGPTLFS